MNSRLLIAPALFIVCQAIYDGFGLIQNTNWSIFYYTSQYASWLLLIILLTKFILIKKFIPHYILATGLIIYILIELSNWGTSYEDYYLNVNKTESIILPLSVMLTALTTYIIKLCRQ